MKIYTVRVFLGRETYDASGKLTSESFLVKLEHDTRQFDAFVKCARTSYSRIQVVGVTDGVINKETGLAKQLEPDPAVVKMLEDCVKPVPKKLSVEEQTIKDLQERLAALESGGSTAKDNAEPVKNDEKLESARLEYFQLFGKKPHHLLTTESILEKIKEHK